MLKFLLRLFSLPLPHRPYSGYQPKPGEDAKYEVSIYCDLYGLTSTLQDYATVERKHYCPYCSCSLFFTVGDLRLNKFIVANDHTVRISYKPTIANISSPPRKI